MVTIDRRVYFGFSLLFGTALAAALGTAQGPTQPPGAAPSASAETANNNSAAIVRMDRSYTTADQKEIVVTGTSRGVPPTGSSPPASG